MASLNKVMLIGHLTRAPELRFPSAKATVCSMRLAINRRFKTAAGEQRQDTCYVDVEVWGRQAESCQKYLHCGSMLMVEGSLRYDEWEDRNDGQRRQRLSVQARRVQFLDPKPEEALTNKEAKAS